MGLHDLFASPATFADVGLISRTNFSVFNVTDPAYGALGNGTHDDSTAINAAITAANAAGGGIVVIPRTGAGYNIGTAGVILRANVDVVAIGGGLCTLTYSGTGDAIDGWTNSFNGEFRGFYVHCTNVAASWARFGNQSQFVRLINVQGAAASASALGSGLVLDGRTTGPNAFSGFIWLQNVQTLLFPIGIDVIGGASGGAGQERWTFIQGTNVSLVGPGSGVVGSRGIRCDTNTNNEGSKIWASIEAFEKRFDFASPSPGLSVYGGFESNGDDGTLPVVPATFAGVLEDYHASWRYSAMANGVSNRWNYESVISGVRKVAQRGASSIMFLAGAAPYDWTVDRGDEDGLNGETFFGAHFLGVGGYDPASNSLILAGKKLGKAGRTAYAVTDASPAALTLIDNGSYYERTADGRVRLFFSVTYPVTADSNHVELSLPVNQAAEPSGFYHQGGYLVQNASGTPYTLAVDPTGSVHTFLPLTVSGTRPVNSALSGTTFAGVIEYTPTSLAA